MREILIGSQEAGQRLDAFLKKIFPSAPLSFFYKALRKRVVTVGKKTAEPDYRLVDGDVLRCFLPDAEYQKFLLRPKRALPVSQKEPVAVLFEDDDVLALNKPAGVSVHPGDHKTNEISLIQRAQDYLNGSYDRLGFRPSLAHRLDRDTSGVILIGKTPKALATLTESFRGRDVQKQYVAICAGVPSGLSGVCRAPLLRVDDARDEAKVRVDKAGRPATTLWKVLSISPDKKWSLIACEPKTGLTHQIRVHLASLGCPIIGDKSYGNPRINAYARTLGIGRQMLHAHRLTLPHPSTGKSLSLESPIVGDFSQSVTLLKLTF